MVTPHEAVNDDMHIDVCVECGRYYGYTPALSEAWHRSAYRHDKIMPQLCYNCMTRDL